MTVPALDGVLVVNKPRGPSSHDVVVVARRALGVRRVGHTGTLDPQASGVLPLVIGQATRLAQHLTRSDKEYRATIRFGIATDTHDAAGTVLQSSDVVPGRSAVEAGLAAFRGTYDQTPPAYSAKMVGGERSYARARAGKPLAAPAVRVTVHALELIALDGAACQLRVRCSAGFYVRALAHDLGQALGCGAMLEHLERTEAAGFRLDDALSFEALVQGPRSELRGRVLPMEALLRDVPAVTLTAEGVAWARHGRPLGTAQLATPRSSHAPVVRLLAPDGRLVGLARPAPALGVLHVTLVFSYN